MRSGERFEHVGELGKHTFGGKVGHVPPLAGNWTAYQWLSRHPETRHGPSGPRKSDYIGHVREATQVNGL